MNIFKRAHIRFILYRHAIPHRLWLEIEENMPLLQGMTAVEKAHLRALSTLFLHEKNLVGVQGLELSAEMRVTVAIQACLPVLKLGLSCLSGWTDIVIYPGPFRVGRDSTDEWGVVHHQDRILSGESWSRGPVILSWADVAREMRERHAGRSVVIHEIAHKLDVLNGSCNGFPPLHQGMSIPAWTAAMSGAYQDLLTDFDRQRQTCIDPYAATSPAEFFAVASEYFFCSPEVLLACFADVYRQLALYYRQEPLRRMEEMAG